MKSPDSLFWDWVKTIVNTFGQVISFVLWGLLTWDVWLTNGTENPPSAQPDEAPREPAGEAR